MRPHRYKGIPKNTSFCYKMSDEKINEHTVIKNCRYWKLKKDNKYNKHSSPIKDCYEYCKLLKKGLHDGDRIKECKIYEGNNNDWTEEIT